MKPVGWILFGLGVLGAIALLLLAPPWFASGRASNDTSLESTLRFFGGAQADFRGNDRDGDRISDYWRRDIAGLYALAWEGEGGPEGDSLIRIELITKAMADADAAPVVPNAAPKPFRGCWFRALRYADEDTRALDPNRFAVQMYPAGPGGDRRMFISGHLNAVWSKPAVPGGIDVFPADPAAEGWIQVR